MHDMERATSSIATRDTDTKASHRGPRGADASGAAAFDEVHARWLADARSTGRVRREGPWERRKRKLRERLALEQEIYAQRLRQWAIEQELHAQHRQLERDGERAALSELGAEPGSIEPVSPVLPTIRGGGPVSSARAGR